MPKNLLILIAPAIASLVLTACVGGSTPGEDAAGGKIAVEGMVLVDLGLAAEGEALSEKGCPPIPTNDYEGKQVTFKTGSGETAGLATLGPSQQVHKNNPPVAVDGAFPIYCGYPFETEVNPSEFYSVAISGQEGELNLSADELDEPVNLVLD